MANRNRFRIQPSLEPMEPRVVLSQLAVAPHDVRAVATHLDHVNKHAPQPIQNQHAINAGLKRLQQQLQVIQTRAQEHTPSAQETPAEKVKSETSSLLKNIFASL